MKKLYLCVSAAAIAASVASPGMAQVAGGPPPGEVSDQSGASVAEVLVTAQRRSEREQDVPISISVVTAQIAERQGVTGTESLGLAVPALQFSRQTGNGGTPFIRGVGTSDGTGGSESPVAVYVDDVYVGSPAATLFQFNNIEGIEVLKGPQGTLFGRNATGGVVNVHTKKPSQEVALDASVGYGSYGTYYGSLYATGGLSDTVSMNVAVAGKDQSNGYGRNLVTGADTLKGWNDGIRSELLWEPSQATSLLVTGEYSDRKDDAGMSVVIWPGTVATGGGTYKDRYGTYDTPADFSQSKTWDTSAIPPWTGSSTGMDRPPVRTSSESTTH
jgi:iron complex outermembrane recepter protein